MTDPNGLLTIGNYSLFTRLTPKALRLYEEKELLVPVKKEITGYRFYDYSQIRRGIQLKRLAGLGFGLVDMGELLDAMDRGDRETIDRIVCQRLQEIDAQSAELERIRGELEGRALVEMIEMEFGEPMIKDIPSIRVVTRREKGRYDEAIPRLIGELYGFIYGRSPGAKAAGPPMVLYHDGEYKEYDADVEVAVPITGRVADDPRYEVKTWEAMRAVSLVYKGPYDRIGEAWGRMTQHLGSSHYEYAAPCRELYLNDPSDTPPDQLLTELLVPIR